MNLRQLEVFQAVIRTGNMTTAARLVCVTPSAVSKIISHTELQLGYKLFNRRQGALVPTPEARVLSEASNAIHSKVDELRRIAVNLRQVDHGQVRVAALPAIAHDCLPAVVERYARANPAVQIEVRTLHQHQMADALLTCSVDFALGYFPHPHPQLTGRLLASGPLYAVTTRELWQRAERVRRADPMAFLAGTPMIRLVGDDPLREPADRLAELMGVQPPSTLLVQTSRLALELVRRGLGWTVIDFLTARNMRGPADNDLEWRQLDGVPPVPLLAYHATAWPPGRHALRMLELLQEQLGACTA